MNCEEGERSLTAYLDGTLGGDAQLRFELHLETCGGCQDEVDLWHRLAEVPSPSPSARMRLEFERSLAGELNRRPNRPVTPALPWYGWAAAALLLVTSGWGLGRVTTRGTAEPPAEVSALRQEVSSLRSMVALSLLAQESASSRLQGISYAGRLKQESPDVVGALVSALEFDSNVNVRLAACDALRRYRGEPSVRQAFVSALGKESSPLMKVTLIDTLADLGERDSVAPLRRLSASETEDASVRERALRALDRMKSKGITWE